VAACMSAMAIKPDYLEARQNLTAAYECLALEEGAIKKYLDQIRKNPGDPGLHYNLGIAYEERGLNEQALNEFLSAIKLDPKHQLAHYKAARLYDAQLRADETIDMCKRFVDLLMSNRLPVEKEWCVNRVRELQFR
jgi:tetratricopeptide (TPR) repeat protein